MTEPVSYSEGFFRRAGAMKGKTYRSDCHERCEFEDIFNGGAGGIYGRGSNESGRG